MEDYSITSMLFCISKRFLSSHNYLKISMKLQPNQGKVGRI